mmetsp:Transcript_8052/g.15818  ORF Transcript_8052/g.15818 Transcript_8052/m.15818 type:complete len:1505 (-) Transcript_8052:34-4548(-)
MLFILYLTLQTVSSVTITSNVVKQDTTLRLYDVQPSPPALQMTFYSWIKFNAISSSEVDLISVEYQVKIVMKLTRAPGNLYKASLLTDTISTASSATAFVWDFVSFGKTYDEMKLCRTYWKVSTVTCSTAIRGYSSASLTWDSSVTLKCATSNFELYGFNLLFSYSSNTDLESVVTAAACHTVCDTNCFGPAYNACNIFIPVVEYGEALKLSPSPSLTLREGSTAFQGKTFRSTSKIGVTGWFYIVSKIANYSLCELIRLNIADCNMGDRSCRLPAIFYYETNQLHFAMERTSTSQNSYTIYFSVSAYSRWAFFATYFDKNNYNTIDCTLIQGDSFSCSTRNAYPDLHFPWYSAADSAYKIQVGSESYYDCGLNIVYRDVRVYVDYALTTTSIQTIYGQSMNVCTPYCSSCPDFYTCSGCQDGYYLSLGVCKACHATCKTCTAGTSFDCSSCDTSKRAYMGLCVNDCPTSSTSSSTTCTLSNADLLYYQLVDLTQLVYDETLSCHGRKGLAYAKEDSRDPQPSFQRGLYFDGDDILSVTPQSSDTPLVMPVAFTMEAWIRPTTASGTIFSGWKVDSIDFYSSITVLKVVYASTLSLWIYNKSQYTTTFSIAQGDWHYIAMGIEHSSSTHRVCFVADSSNACSNIDISGYEEFNSDDRFGVGFLPTGPVAFQDFFQGFMYKLRFLNYFLLPTTLQTSSTSTTCTGSCSLCPPNKCLSTCSFSQYISSTGACDSCDSTCAKGCYDYKTCGMSSETLSSSCRSFLLGCTDCYTNRCKSCLDEHSIYSSGNCICDPSYIDVDSSLSLLCTQCSPQCATCSSPDYCLSCNDANAILTRGQCFCKHGYYDSDLSLTGVKCEACFKECYTCADSHSCSSCKVESESLERACCSAGKYKLGDECDFCGDNCKSCLSPSVCLSCFDENAEVIDGVKCQCKQGTAVLSNSPLKCLACEKGYFVSGSVCEKCHDNCETCSASGCLTCKEKDKIPWLLGGCWNCPSKCKSCSSKGCETCIEGADLFELSCVCREGFKDTGASCVEVKVSFDLSVTEGGELLLTFSEGLDLSKAALKLKVEGVEGEVDFTLERVSDNEYLLVPSDEVEVNKGTMTSVSISQDKLKGALLINSSDSTLAYSSPVKKSSDDKTADKFASITDLAVTLSVVTVAVLGLLSGSLSTTWSLLNTLAVLAYIPMINLDMPNLLKKVLKSLVFRYLPNAFSYFVPDSDSDVHVAARRIDSNSSFFLLTAGDLVTVFAAIVATIPFVALLQSFQNMKASAFLIQVRENFKWNFFVRYTIQAYIGFIFAGILQCYDLKFSSLTYAANSVAALLSLLVCAFATLWCIYFTVTHHSLFLYFSPLAHSYGSLFEEFKNDRGLLSCSYYSLFALRRVLYMASLFFLSDFPGIQVILCLFHSSLSVLLVSVYSPFKSPLHNLSNLLNEVGTLLVFGLTGAYYFDLNSFASEIIKWASCGVVYSVILQMLILSIKDSLFIFSNFQRKFCIQGRMTTRAEIFL